MKIERSSEGVLHVIESGNARTIRFESQDGQPLLQVLSTLSSVPLGRTGYDVMRFPRARITLIVEADDEPDYSQVL